VLLSDSSALLSDPSALLSESPEPFPTPEDGPTFAALEARDEPSEDPGLYLPPTSPEPVESPFLPDSSSRQVMADEPAVVEEPAVFPSVSSYSDLIPPPDPAWPVEPDVLVAQLGDPILPPPDDVAEEIEEPSFFTLPDPEEIPSPSEPADVQALADDPAPGEVVAIEQTQKPDDEISIIPLKPQTTAKTPVGLGVYEGSGVDVFDDTPPRSELQERLMNLAARAISAYDRLLTGWFERLRRRQASPAPVPPVPVPSPPEGPTLYGKASAWLDGLTQGASRLVHQDRSSWPALPNLPHPSRGLGLTSSSALKPPPALGELPVLRLAPIPVEEMKVEGDVYEYEGEGVVSIAWRWTKRIVVTGGLVAGGLYAALTWESWLPKAERVSRAAFTEVDRLSQAQRQRKALQEATRQLPHLPGKTIQQIMATSLNGVLEPPEVFRLASDAADRGLSALTEGEAQELKQLRSELLSPLRASERERIQEYDEARTRRLVFPFEDRDVAQLFAQATDNLEPESRARLQELLGKAINAGLAPPNEAARR